MSNVFASQTEHSAEYFGDARNYWWNDDFLALALRRWAVVGVRAVLDVGCGVGHWSRAWARVLPPTVEFTCVDREPVWVEKALEGSSRAGLGPRCHGQVANAEALPFSDGRFDFVTCQTLLIHVRDVRAALSEMVRVTRPGGIVVAAEPNNAALPVLEDALAVGLPVEETSELLRFHLTCLRGKAVLGLGDESIGRILPSEFKQAGLVDVSVCMNEKACPLIPPYTTPRERAILEEITDWAQRDFWIWSRSDTVRYLVAGGGEENDFAPLWELAMELRRRVKEAVLTRTLACAGGALFYLIAGRKPSTGISAKAFNG